MSKYKYQKEFLFSTKKLEDIELFLENEQSPVDLLQIRDGKGNTAIHHCAYLNQHRHIDFYIKYYRMNLENQGYTVSEIKTQTKVLLNEKNAEGLTAAHYAAFKGNITVLKSLQKYEADLYLPSNLGMTLLHFAAQGDKINTVLFLHQKQFNINAKDNKRSTPLHWACYSGSEKIVEYLLAQQEVLIDQEDLDGHTPLHITVAYGYSKIVKKLLIAGADRGRRDGDGHTALEIARQNEFEKIGKMLDDRYSFIDYLKFICNAKVRYQPKNRSYLQPILYYSLSLIMLALSFAVISISVPALYIAQAVVFGCSILLFTSLILPPKQHPPHHSYDFFCERQQINHLCMVCLRAMQSREYHCPTCAICVPQYDHHCFWINNCVGKNNILRFNIFLILTELSLLWLGYLAARLLLLLAEGESSTSLFSINPFVEDYHLSIAVIVMAVIVCLVVLFLAVPMLCLILIQQKNLLLGRTSYQRFSKSNESVLTREGSAFLNRSWQGSSPPSLKNCVGMCYDSQQSDKSSQSNSTSSSFIRQH